MRIKSLQTAYAFLRDAGLPMQLDPDQALLGMPLTSGCHLFLSWPTHAEILPVAVATPLHIADPRLQPVVALALMGQNRTSAAASWVLDSVSSTVDYRTHIHLEADGTVSGELLLRVLTDCRQTVPRKLSLLARLCAGDGAGAAAAPPEVEPGASPFVSFAD